MPANEKNVASDGRRYGRMIGLLFLLTLIGGSLGEVILPGKIIVSGDAAATAHHVITMQTTFRLGFAFYLIEGLCDAALAAFFYLLLRPVNRDAALVAAFLGVISTAIFAVNESFYFFPSVLLSGAPYLNVFTPDQLNAAAYLCFRYYARGTEAFMAFYGVAMLLRGY